MTALKQYQRLECDALWQAAADAQRQDVFVALGDATLVIKDARDTPLAHWSLPAVERVNPGRLPALFRPGPDAEESLELADETMIEAIATVRRALARERPRRGRLRHLVLWLSIAGVAGLGTLWLPDAVVRYTASVLPETVRGETGQRLLQALSAYTGHVCDDPAGVAALAKLRRQTLDDPNWSVVVVPDGPHTRMSLPGRIIVLRQDVIAAAQGPQPAVAAMATAARSALARDPMADFMETAGTVATMQLLTRGTVSEARIAAYVAALLETRSTELGTPANAGGPPASGAVAGPDGRPGSSAFDDADWLRLTAICE